MVQKTVNIKAKAGLKSSIMVQNTDSYYLKDHYLSQNISAKVQIQGSTTQKSKLKESKLKNSKPANRKTLAPLRINKPEKISH